MTSRKSIVASLAFTAVLFLTLAPRASGEPPVTALAVSPDGSVVLSGSQAGLRVHAFPGLEVSRRIKTQLVEICSVRFSPDGRRVAIAGGIPAEGGMVEIRSWPSLELQRRIEAHADTIQAISWRDREVFATASLDRTSLLWDRSKEKPIREIIGHSKGLTAATFLGSAGPLMTGSIDQNLRIWDATSGRLIRTLNNHTGPIHSIAIRPATGEVGASVRTMVATVGEDRTVRFWQPTIGRLVRFSRLDAVPMDAAWSIDGSRLTVVCDDGSVRVINPETAKEERTLGSLKGWGYKITRHPTEGQFIAGGHGGELRVFEGKPTRLKPSSSK